MNIGMGIAIAGIWIGSALAIWAGAMSEIVIGSTIATLGIAFFGVVSTFNK